MMKNNKTKKASESHVPIKYDMEILKLFSFILFTFPAELLRTDNVSPSAHIFSDS